MERPQPNSSKTLSILLHCIVIIGTVFRMEYFLADIAIQGRIRSGEYPFVVGVLDGPRGMPRGIAVEVGQTSDGFATWKLKVGGSDVPGRFVIDDGRFVPVEFDSGSNQASDHASSQTPFVSMSSTWQRAVAAPAQRMSQSSPTRNDLTHEHHPSVIVKFRGIAVREPERSFDGKLPAVVIAGEPEKNRSAVV